MSTAYEGLRSTQSGQGRGMVSLQNQASCGFVASGLGDQSGLGLRMRAPQHENASFCRFSDGLNNCVSERLPTLSSMTGGQTILHSQAGVEQQHPICSPRAQAGIKRWGLAQVSLQFFENIAQRWWRSNA